MYFITKREKCEVCNGTGRNVFIDKNSLAVNSSSLAPFHPQTTVTCGHCVKGYIDTPVEVEPVEIHCGVVFVAKTDALGNPIDTDVSEVIGE